MTPQDDSDTYSQGIHDSHIGGDVNQYIINRPHYAARGSASTVDDESSATDEEGSSSGPLGSLVGFAVVIFIIYSVLQSCGATDPTITSDAHDLGAALRGAALEAVSKALQDCAEETSPQPARCPQTDTSLDKSAAVRWTILGDPVDGSAIGFIPDATPSPLADGKSVPTGTIQVMGVALMTVESTAGASYFDLKEVRYFADLSAQGTAAELRSIQATRNTPPYPKTISKRQPPIVNVVTVGRAVDHLRYCTSVTTVRQPAGCPQVGTMPEVQEIKQPRWTLDRDPALNARVTWDGESGLEHVTGHLQMTLHDGTKTVTTVSRDYESLLLPGPQWPTVIQTLLKEQPSQ